jgi:hypothetical protein
MIKTSLIDRKFAEYFRRPFKTRESSEYELAITFGEEEVQTLIINAEKFLKIAPRIHGKKTLNLNLHPVEFCRIRDLEEKRFNFNSHLSSSTASGTSQRSRLWL